MLESGEIIDPSSNDETSGTGGKRRKDPKNENHDLLADHAKREAERLERMARLRAENEEEEKRKNANESTSVAARHEKTPQNSIIEVDQEELEGLDEEEQMQRLLGFGGFGTTKGQKVDDNHNSSAKGAAAKHKARKYRQYMNRKGGFKNLEKMD